jgi:hypothetical protein
MAETNSLRGPLRARMLALLKKLEWASTTHQEGNSECPSCGADEHVDRRHDSDCELKALLDELAREEP